MKKLAYATVFGLLNGARVAVYTARNYAENNKFNEKDLESMRRLDKEIGRLATKIFKEAQLNKPAQGGE